MKQPQPKTKYTIKRGMLGMKDGFTVCTDLDIRALCEINGVNAVNSMSDDTWAVWTSERYSPDEIEAALHEAMQEMTKE